MIGTLSVGTLSVPIPVSLNSYESIATVNVSSSVPYIDFTSIPSDYKHLQIRALYTTVSTGNNLYMTLNGSTNSTYYHYLFGDGSSATAGASSTNLISVQWGGNGPAYYGMILDILDYGSTSKNKTIRTLGGIDNNGSGGVYFSSNLYSTTSAVSSLRIGCFAEDLKQYSQFALYGIKD